MPSGGDDPSAKRYDCFIAFHGSHALSDLGFDGPGLDCDVRTLARKVHDRLANFPRRPSVFLDESEIDGHWLDSLSRAILQLRGGGVALVLLTAEYLTRKYCLAELRAFLDLERLGSVAGREDEAIDIRVIVLEPNIRTVSNALQNDALNDFVGAKLQNLQWRLLPMEKRRNDAQVVCGICEHVEKFWNSKEGMCLGGELSDCADYLSSFFRDCDVHSIARKLRFRPEDFSHGFSVSSVFCKALDKGMFSEPFYVSELDSVAADVRAKNALAAFRRKWSSGSWLWSITPGENDICLEKNISEAERALENVKDRNPQLGERGSSAATGGEKVERTNYSSDDFRPFFPAQSNLDSALVPGAAATCLAQLRAAVVPGSCSGDRPPDEAHSGRAGGGLSLRRVALTFINGEGGVGKTSACKLLCVDPDIRKYFKEGAILWIDVGRGAAEEKVIGELRRAVSSCGGKLAAKEIKELSNVSEAVERACEFFLGRRLLVIVDNVWETPQGSRVKSWTDTLSKITECPESAIVTTTRSLSLALSPGCNRVDLGCLDLKTEGSADWKIAETLYDVFVKETAEKQACDGYKKIRSKALRLSCGNRLGITTFAGLVRSISGMGGDVGDVLDLIGNNVSGLASEAVGERQKSATGHDGLNAAMKESLSYLDKRNRQDFAVESAPFFGRWGVIGSDSLIFRASYEAFPENAFSARYAALNVMRASTSRLPFEVLCRLWHVPTVADAKEIARAFIDIGLGKIERGGDSGLEKYFAQFCAGLYRSSQKRVDGHALLLSSCHSLIFSRPEYAKSGAAGWAQFCFEASTTTLDLSSADAALKNYLSYNLICHLCSTVPSEASALQIILSLLWDMWNNFIRPLFVAVPARASSSFGEGAPSAAALKQGIWTLLCNFSWLRGRKTSNCCCIYSLQRDFRFAFKSCLLDNSETAFLQKLQNTLMHVRNQLVESDGTLASLLVQLAHSIKVEGAVSVDDLLEQLVRSAENEVRGAWLKPVSGCYNPCGAGVLRKAFISSSAVEVLSDLGDETHFVSLSGDGTIRIHDVSNLGTVCVLGDIGRIRAIAVVQQRLANGCPFVFSGEVNGAVLCYEVLVDEPGTLSASSRAVGKTNSRISCLSASKDGKAVAAGCDDGNFCVWELDGGNSGSFVLKTTFSCFAVAADGGRGLITSAAVSVSGNVLAAGSYGDGFYVWREGNESAEGLKVGPTSLTSEDDRFKTFFLSLSSDEATLIVLFKRTTNGPPACETWNVEAGERRLSRVELPELSDVSCAYLEGSCAGEKFEHSLLVGGWGNENLFVLLEYSIGEGLPKVRRCVLSVLPISVCRLDFSDLTRLSTVIVGGSDGSVRLLGADAFVNSSNLKQRALLSRKSGMHLEEAFDPTPSPELKVVSAVAVMPDAGRVVAGHVCGRLSLWSSKDGSLLRVVDNEMEADWVRCIDISDDESVAVTGHRDGTVLVWETRTWTVRRVLEGHSGYVCCVALKREGNRICSVDWDGECRVWDAVRGGAALGVIETGLKFSHFRTLAFVSSDGGHLIWATRDEDEPWKAKAIDFGGQCVADASLSNTVAIGSWKKAAVFKNKSCKLRDLDEEGGRYWPISGQGSRVQCQLKSAGGGLSDTASINLGSAIESIKAHWLPHRGQDGRGRAIVACQLYGKSAPAIMHFITPKV